MTERPTDALRALLPEVDFDVPVPTGYDTTAGEEMIRDILDKPLRDGTHLRAVAAARKVVEEAEKMLLESVRTAVSAGDSWTMIGLALRTSKQNAHRKYAPLLAGPPTTTNEVEAVAEAAGHVMRDLRSFFSLYHPTTWCEGVNMPSNNNDRHVVPGKNGGWDVVKPGSDRPSSHHDKQSDAIDRGRDIVRNAGGGELNIHGRDGQIRAKDTIPNGNDPRSSKG